MFPTRGYFGRVANPLRRALMLVTLCAICFVTAPSQAQPTNQREELERAYVAAFRSDDFGAAERHARAWVRLRPDDFIPQIGRAHV